MQNASFAGRFKVGTRIHFGFLLILALLGLVAVFGVRALTGVEAGFNRYAAISDNSLRLSELDGDVSDMRRNVVNYSFSGNNALIEPTRAQQKQLGQTLRSIREATQDPGRRANLDRMIQIFDSYAANFTKLTDIRERRDRLYEEELLPIGSKARENISQIMASGMADGDLESASGAGVVMEKLMVSRISALHFLATPSAKALDEVKTRNADFRSAITAFADRQANPARKRLAEDSAQLGARYLDTVNSLSSVVTEAQTLAFTTMVDEAEQFADLVNKTVASQNDSRLQVQNTMKSDTSETVTLVTGLAIGAFVIGMLIAYLTARSIVKPVVGMTGTMTDLAAGNLTVTVPALANQDEIGEMAKAVQVFKENAIEKKRMDEAERDRLEAERRAAEAQRQREQAIGEEIAGLIDAVSKGDLERRIDLNGKEGFYRTMSDGINRLTDTVESVIADLGEVLSALAQGDLNSRVTRDYQGAFQQVKTDVNATSVKLAEIVGQITQAADTIASAAAEVSLGSSDLADRTEQQASSLEETAASMEELGATVRSNADNAQRANIMASEARTAAESGNGVTGSAIDAMRRIEESSRKITDIIGVIDEIAFQTNLLALNAAVEAARAGDAGRGFAVVAQEVRQLAQRSAQASKEIKGLIMDSDAQVKDGVDLVKKAGGALNGIVSGVHQVATLIAEMASASAEQATALDEINATVASMDEMTQKNAALVEETTAAAQAMSGQAGDLKGLIGFFKLETVNAAPMRMAANHAVSATPVRRTVAATRPASAAKAAAKTAAKPALRPVAAPRPPVQVAGNVLTHSVSDDDDWKEF
ncbi:methyl-accepting chemotaxis protein [Azospirillum doebereinerae]|uniref:methyl-accepting chemotaxis protein n=1 Tax=Azospirillum doebereinerae TaxID=92933 RepID=UPI001EE62FBF|nr:methyl-accepting chemotaxis protein [Azospirillum doebereinerae]MCG5241045.1 methyl-accepting chemotaxis protein [Azospirillum doebereinerae]